MEGMQVMLSLTGVSMHKPVWTATYVALTTQPRPSAPRDSLCELIGACIRFLPMSVGRFCALPELTTNWMMSMHQAIVTNE